MKILHNENIVVKSLNLRAGQIDCNPMGGSRVGGTGGPDPPPWNLDPTSPPPLRKFSVVVQRYVRPCCDASGMRVDAQDYVAPFKTRETVDFTSLLRFFFFCIFLHSRLWQIFTKIHEMKNLSIKGI